MIALRRSANQSLLDHKSSYYQFEQYSQPYQDAQGNFGYRSQQIALRHESVTLPEFSERSLDLESIFPSLKVE